MPDFQRAKSPKDATRTTALSPMIYPLETEKTQKKIEALEERCRRLEEALSAEEKHREKTEAAEKNILERIETLESAREPRQPDIDIDELLSRLGAAEEGLSRALGGTAALSSRFEAMTGEMGGIRSEVVELMRSGAGARGDEQENRERDERLKAAEVRLEEYAASLQKLVYGNSSLSRELGEKFAALSGGLKAAEANIGRLSSQFNSMLAHAAHIARAEAAAEEARKAAGRAESSVADCLERQRLLDELRKKMELELKTARDMVSMLSRRVSELEEKLVQSGTEMKAAAEAVRESRKELKELASGVNDVSGKGAVLWTRVVSLEREAENLKSRLLSSETERREMMQQVKTQVNNMQALLGKL
ncbi:MAG: hypothetical protein AB1734_01695 [Elusimicrobiota bacterium]